METVATVLATMGVVALGVLALGVLVAFITSAWSH